MRIQRLLHASLLVSDTQRSLTFYRDVLGMRTDPDRPDLQFPGAWLVVGEQQLHLLELPNPDPIDGRPEHGGRDRHTAFAVDAVDELTVKLTSNDIPYTQSKSGRRAIFCRDPDGNALEFIEE